MSTTRHGVVEFYVDAKGEHRWRRMASNGKILAVSSEGYHNEDEAVSAMYASCGSLDGVAIVSTREEAQALTSEEG